MPLLWKDSILHCRRSECPMVGREGILMFTWTDKNILTGNCGFLARNISLNLYLCVTKVIIKKLFLFLKKETEKEKGVTCCWWEFMCESDGQEHRRSKKWGNRKRLSIFRQSATQVIIRQFGFFWVDQYRTGRPRARGLWFPVYYSVSACKWS